jgi:hypothetical protein
MTEGASPTRQSSRGRVQTVNRTAVLDQEGKVLPGAAEVLGQENEVSIGKIAWLSRRDSGKVYGSMVVYVTKRSDAARLLRDQYFHVAGESGCNGRVIHSYVRVVSRHR